MNLYFEIINNLKLKAYLSKAYCHEILPQYCDDYVWKSLCNKSTHIKMVQHEFIQAQNEYNAEFWP